MLQSLLQVFMFGCFVLRGFAGWGGGWGGRFVILEKWLVNLKKKQKNDKLKTLTLMLYYLMYFTHIFVLC